MINKEKGTRINTKIHKKKKEHIFSARFYIKRVRFLLFASVILPGSICRKRINLSKIEKCLLF